MFSFCDYIEISPFLFTYSLYIIRSTITIVHSGEKTKLQPFGGPRSCNESIFWARSMYFAPKLKLLNVSDPSNPGYFSYSRPIGVESTKKSTSKIHAKNRKKPKPIENFGQKNFFSKIPKICIPLESDLKILLDGVFRFRLCGKIKEL